MKKTIDIPSLNAKADFDENWFNPVKKMGAGTYRGVIENYFNADVEIGSFSCIGSPLFVFGNTEHPNIFNREFVSNYPFGDKWDIPYPKTKGKGKIIIGSDVWIGGYVSILSGVEVGDGAIIGACAVVAKDIPPFAVVVGNPARIIRCRFDDQVISKLLKIKWWRWDERTIKERIEDFKDIKSFVEKYDKQ